MLFRSQFPRTAGAARRAAAARVHAVADDTEQSLRKVYLGITRAPQALTDERRLCAFTQSEATWQLPNRLLQLDFVIRTSNVAIAFPQALTDERRLRAFTQSEATSQPAPGGAFSMYGGSVSGKFLEVDAPARLVQDWRMNSWPDGAVSKVRRHSQRRFCHSSALQAL